MIWVWSLVNSCVAIVAPLTGSTNPADIHGLCVLWLCKPAQCGHSSKVKHLPSITLSPFIVITKKPHRLNCDNGVYLPSWIVAVGFLAQCTVIGVSVSESHTSELNCDFSYLHVHIVYVFPYVFERDRKIFVQLDSHHNFRQLPLRWAWKMTLIEDSQEGESECAHLHVLYKGQQLY